MNPSKFTHSSTKGSALITVVSLIFIMAMLSASIIGYSLFERRMNERSRLVLRSENVAENITLYAAEQLTVKLQGMGTPVVGHFPWTGPSTNTLVVYMPPASASGADNVLVSEYNTMAAAAAMEVRAGIEAKTDYTKVSDTNSTNNGLQVATANVPIVAKGTATHPSLGTITTYVEQDMQLTLIPLFQFGMFYNMDLELYPSGELTLTGPVHTNNSLLSHPDVGSTNSITFMDRVTAADYILAYQGTKCDTRGGDGVIRTPGDPTLGSVYFTDATPVSPSTAQKDMKSNGNVTDYNSLGSNLWADCRWGDTSRNITTALPTTSQLTSFKNWATTMYDGNLRAGIHGVTKLVLPGIGGYKEINDASTPEDDRNNGRQILESPNHKRYNGTAFAATVDSAALKQVKISWRAGLYIMVNPSDASRSGELPDGTTITLLPRSYRCWLNAPSGGAHVCTEVVLPGQPSYGRAPGPDGTLGNSDDTMYLNYLPNRLMAGTSVGSNQVLRTIQQTYGTGNNAYVATGAAGATTLTVGGGTGTILAGDIVTIGNYNYLVSSDLAGTSLDIASPGLIVAASSAALTINAPTNVLGSTNGSYTTASSGNSLNSTTITLARPSGTGVFLPGTTITVGAYKYLVTVAPTVAPTTSTYEKIYIAAPGLQVASDSSAVKVDDTSRTLGTATDYAITGSPAAGATTLGINSGVGTLLPGNAIVVGTGVNAHRYLVTSSSNTATATTALSSITITPALINALTTGNLVTIDPYAYTGYATSGNGGAGSVYPADSSANAYAAEAYFYDIRRANNNGANSTASNSTAFNRSVANPYKPRPIAKIDFDLARFKMMVNRVNLGATTSSGYRLTLPDSTGANWSNCIYNGATSTTTTSLGLGIYNTAGTSYSAAACFPDGSNLTRQNPFGLYKAPLNSTERDAVFTDPTQFSISSTSLNSAWYDGIAVYIHSVDAEVRAQTTANIADRIDSGVRLLNGRGPVASLTAGTPDSTSGCTIATNDAVYVIGHYNANGTLDSVRTDEFNGGYSSKWPDSNLEYLCSVYGDATTILSQPTYTESASAPYTYSQSAGWSDTFSALPASASASGWDSAAAGGADGVYNATIKLSAVPTEISTVLVIGLVPSNHNPTGLSDRPPSSGANNVNSGGANNFPRFLEAWGDANPLYIRGSMIALFESRVAMEPFTHSRCYNRPLRRWGLHNKLSEANHHVPLEPIVYSADRLGFRQLTAVEYAARKATIEGWTELTP